MVHVEAMQVLNDGAYGTLFSTFKAVLAYQGLDYKSKILLHHPLLLYSR